MIEFALETAKLHGGLTQVEGLRAAREVMVGAVELYFPHDADPRLLEETEGLVVCDLGLR